MSIKEPGNFASAFISLFLYLSLSCTCAYFANKFWDRETRTMRGGRYAMPKFIFFVVLGVSALFDLPSFFGCLIYGGPSACVWDDGSYQFCWACHLVASCGYAFAIITPSILWSDIIQQKDGNFLNSSSPLDAVKIFFRIAFLLYCSVIAATIVGAIIYSKASDESSYSSSNDVGNLFGNLLTPITLFVITLGCVGSGKRLQDYVRSVHLGTVTQMKIIRKLNFTMMLIATTYGMRAMLVLSLYKHMPQPYIDVFQPTHYYPVWMILTQWLPYIVCSYSLVNSMRFKEEGKPSEKKLRGTLGAGGGSAGDLEGRNSPRKVGNNINNASSRSNMSFSIESGDTRSPFDHTLSNDSTASSVDNTNSTDNKTLDFLLTVASEKNKDMYLAQSPCDEESSIDHFFTQNALTTRESHPSMGVKEASFRFEPVIPPHL